MNPKLTPYTFAIGSMIFALSLVQCGHSVYDHFMNGTEGGVTAWLFGAFAVMGYLGYLLAAVSIDFALRGDFHRNNHYAGACSYELRRISTVLMLVSIAQFWFFEEIAKAFVTGIAGGLLFTYSIRVNHRVQNYPYKVSKWFKIF